MAADPNRIWCPRCGSRALNPLTLICACSAEFASPAALALWRDLPPSEALRK